MENQLIITYLQGLDKKFDSVLDRLNANSIIIASHTDKLDAVQEQTTKTNGRVSRLEDTNVDVKRVLAEQIHWNSKIHGQFEAHQQWVKERIKDNKDFAEREINLLKAGIGHACEVDSEVEVEKIKYKSETWKTVSATIGILVGLIIGIVNIIYK